MEKKLIIWISSALIGIVIIGLVVVIVLTSTGNGNKGKSSNGAVNSSGIVYSRDSDSKNGVGYGDTVRIPIKVTQNPGMIAAKTVINYDASVFEYVDTEEGMFKDINASCKDGKVTCLMTGDFSSSSGDITATGTAATLVFKIKSGAKAGKYFMSVDENSCQYANLNEELVYPKVSIPSQIVIE